MWPATPRRGKWGLAGEARTKPGPVHFVIVLTVKRGHIGEKRNHSPWKLVSVASCMCCTQWYRPTCLFTTSQLAHFQHRRQYNGSWPPTLISRKGAGRKEGKNVYWSTETSLVNMVQVHDKYSVTFKAINSSHNNACTLHKHFTCSHIYILLISLSAFNKKK